MIISHDQEFLSRFYVKDDIASLTDEEVEQLRKAKDMGDAYAQYAYARWLYFMNPFQGALREAERLFYANKDLIPDSLAAYASMLRFGETEVTHPAEVDGDLFLELLDKSVLRGSVLGAMKFSIIRIYGIFYEAEPQQVYDEIRLRLYDDPNIHRHWHVILAYACEELGEDDEAIEHYETAIEKGDLSAYGYLLAFYYRRGNIALAEEIFEEGCKKGAAGCLSYEADYNQEEFLKMSEQEQQAFHDKIDKRLQEGLKRGDGLCVYYLWSHFYFGTLGYPVDKEKALICLKRGMQIADSYSFYIMGIWISDGDVPGRQPTPTEAAEIWLKAVRYNSKDEDSLRQLATQTDEEFLQKHQAEIDKYWRPLWEKLPPVEDCPEEVMETDDYEDEEEVGEDSWTQSEQTYPLYRGEWQFGDTILQRLEGPIGQGRVEYPNGDRFEGYFHLNYAGINGSAYCADGRYTFADGSYIEHAWITTSSRGDEYHLHGVFRIHHPDGPDSICMFIRHQRYGFELFLDKEQPYVQEWYADERLDSQWTVLVYDIDDASKKDCLSLVMTLQGANGIYIVTQQGGRYEANQYDSYYYVPSTKCSVSYPSGDSIDHFGDALKNMKPYNGFLKNHHLESGVKRDEVWKNGEMEKAEEWERDYNASKRMELPNPMNASETVDAYVFKDGFIDYRSGWLYEGKTANDRPEGKGILKGKEFSSFEGWRYEGEFHDGLCHGMGKYDNDKLDIHQHGQFINGVFQEPNSADSPIRLHVKWGHSSWSISSQHPWEYEEYDIEAQLGKLDIRGFRDVRIARIEKDLITLNDHNATYLLAPDKPLNLSCEIEGREWSDGCVYDGDDYSLDLTWLND